MRTRLRSRRPVRDLGPVIEQWAHVRLVEDPRWLEWLKLMATIEALRECWP